MADVSGICCCLSDDRGAVSKLLGLRGICSLCKQAAGGAPSRSTAFSDDGKNRCPFCRGRRHKSTCNDKQVFCPPKCIRHHVPVLDNHPSCAQDIYQEQPARRKTYYYYPRQRNHWLSCLHLLRHLLVFGS